MWINADSTHFLLAVKSDMMIRINYSQKATSNRHYNLKREA
jgi:hypothetical protein